MKSYAKQFGIDDDVNAFIREMKSSHELALEYYARLVRVSIAWAGPLISRKLNPYLYRPAMEEFEFLLQEQ